MIKKMKETIVLICKGGAIGVANIIPGVSGGTLAVVLGIYDRLIEAIADFFTDPESRKKYISFLAKIFIGAVIAIILLASLMDFLLVNYPHQTMFLFMGLILGGIPAVVRSHGDMKVRVPRVLSFFLGAAIVLGLSVFGGGGEASGASSIDIDKINMAGYIMILVAGFMAGGAMIVPGVSGSFILVLMGQYAVIISAIKNMAVKPLALMAIGAASGILVFSRIIKVCLDRIPAITYYFILGLIFASFYKIFPGIPEGVMNILFCAGTFLVGASAAYMISD